MFKTPINNRTWFSNTGCGSYPCHKLEHVNCLFCYCVLYHMKCPGMYTLMENGKKDCSECTFPHAACNYQTVIDILKRSNNETPTT